MTQIFYFSGAGNSKFVAESLAKRLDGEAINLLTFSGEANADAVGFVTGCYCNDIPHKAHELIEKLRIERADYIFSVTTSQASDGYSPITVKKLMTEKGRTLNYAAHVGMLSTFVVTVLPIVGKTEGHYRKNEAAVLDKIAADVKSRITKPVHCRSYPIRLVVSKLSNFGLNKILRVEKKTATDKCVGCGKCVNICPCKNISITDGRAVFGNSCTLCYGCAHICPEGAVKYGFNNIKGNKQYKRFL